MPHRVLLQAMPGYLSLTAAARRKRLSRTAFWHHVRRGDIPTVQIAGRTVVVDGPAFRAWEPNRKRQRETLEGLRKAGVRKS
jgi:hypothetical protein